MRISLHYFFPPYDSYTSLKIFVQQNRPRVEGIKMHCPVIKLKVKNINDCVCIFFFRLEPTAEEGVFVQY